MAKISKKWLKLAKFIIYLRNGYQNRIQHPKIAYGRCIRDGVSYFQNFIIFD